MSFVTDIQELKNGLVIFRRTDVKHRKWYCRIRVPGEHRYKTISLKTTDINEAREKAFDHDADIRFRVRHNVPVFDKSFAQVATEYSADLKVYAESGQMTLNRWKIVDSYIRLHLVPYAGNVQVTAVGEDTWKSYPSWRKKNGKSLNNAPPKDGTIRQEMMTFRAIMNFAANKQYIRERQVPKGKLPKDKARREEFTPQEYRHLHRSARTWITSARTKSSRWYRTVVYNYMLVMTNTGMRTIEARNLRWRDIDVRHDKHRRKFVCINVRGKDKFRELVAAENVASYLDRIRAIAKGKEPDDFVFTNHDGEAATSLYKSLIQSLLKEAKLLHSASGSRRSAYCFRHTYATFRLTEGVDVYFLAKQMGTSVQMIEDYYGHITPAKNAEQILQGIPGWEPVPKNADQRQSATKSPKKASRSRRPSSEPGARRKSPRSRSKGGGDSHP